MCCKGRDNGCDQFAVLVNGLRRRYLGGKGRRTHFVAQRVDSSDEKQSLEFLARFKANSEKAHLNSSLTP